MSTHHSRRRLIAGLLFLSVPASAPAQTSQLSQAILALPSQFIGDQRQIDDARLFAGLVRAVIINQSGTAQDFQGSDLISFQALTRDNRPGPTGIGFTEPFVGTRAAFETFARENAADLLDVFFPTGISTALGGRDTTTLYSQQLLLTTALNTDDRDARMNRRNAALLDAEWLRPDGRQPGDSSWALQGLYAFTPMLSVQGRYNRQQQSLASSNTSAAVDFHPFFERDGAVNLRAGGTARAGFIYSSSTSLDPIESDAVKFVTFDFSGGGWVSAQRRVGMLVVGGAVLLQGTKHYLPPGEDGTFRSALSAALSDRGLEYDVTFGATARADVSDRTSVIVNFTETQALESAVDRPAAHLVMGGVMYSLGPRAAINAGYKVTSFSAALAHSVFLQGHFGW